jgi:predicted dehydrogenase
MKKVAFYGVGVTGTEHFRAFKHTQLFNIVCIASRSRESAESKAKSVGVPYAIDLDEIYQKYTPDLLVVCVPPTAVLGVLQKAFQYPWEILVEKPAGLTLDESKTILEMSNSRNSAVNVWVAMNRRMLPSTLLAKELIEKHRGNKKFPIRINITDQQDTASARLAGHPETVIQNWHFANSIHLIDLACSFLSNPVTLDSLSEKNFERGKIITANLDNEFGDAVHYQAYWNLPAPWSLEVIMTEGWVQQSPIERVRTLFEKHEYHDLTQSHFSEPDGLKPGFYNQAKSLSGFDSRLESHLCTISESHQAMTLLDKIYEK